MVPDPGGGLGSCAAEKGARRGPAKERAAPAAQPGRGAVREAHLIRRGLPQALRLEHPGAPATTHKRNPGDPLRRRTAAALHTARAAESCSPGHRPRRCPSVSGASAQVLLLRSSSPRRCPQMGRRAFSLSG
ncbi:hypothetical protein NDU88_002990 [Pleurodeles waltl]|uniref:Uncharacterized protein n=1 Tax=Pleurodeles waltl TaxID=8319 RepID=A0AAV7UZC0_PLEWA|nr:hypothetical protein NDU88_002990 [Pleurodeles waltl]